MPTVDEQTEPYVVGFYCDPCARRSGRPRLLATASRNPATFGGWDLWVARRDGRTPRLRNKPGGNDGGVPHGDVPQLPVARSADKRLALIPIFPLTPAAQLICRRKVPKGERPHRPRMARTTMVEIAERTEAAGRHDAYV